MNKKIKIIDLLCLISNGEEVPKKIKYEDDIWVWTGDDYRKDISDTFLFTTQHYIWFTDFINNEVEILDDKAYFKQQMNKKLRLWRNKKWKDF